MKEVDQINKGLLCPYCRCATVIRDSKEVYGKSYGPIYICIPCQAWVGVHKESGEALGRLANAELRHYKRLAHLQFDRLWKGSDRIMNRREAYQWLSNIMKLQPELAHIGMFEVDQCKQVVEYCNKILPEGTLRISFENL